MSGLLFFLLCMFVLDAAVSVFVLYLQNIECLSIDSDELLFEDNIAQ